MKATITIEKEEYDYLLETISELKKANGTFLKALCMKEDKVYRISSMRGTPFNLDFERGVEREVFKVADFSDTLGQSHVKTLFEKLIDRLRTQQETISKLEGNEVKYDKYPFYVLKNKEELFKEDEEEGRGWFDWKGLINKIKNDE